MADTPLMDLDELVAPDKDDLGYIVSDPDGTPGDNKVTLANMIASPINSSDAKTTPVDADSVGLVDSADSSLLKKFTWANIKATLKTYFDSLYIGSTFTEAVDAGDYEISQGLFKDSAEVTQALGSLSSSTAISLANGNVVSCTIAAALTFSFTNPPASGSLGILIMEITNGSAYTLDWPSSVEWTEDIVPELQSSGVDQLRFTTLDGGSTWLGTQIFSKAA